MKGLLLRAAAALISAPLVLTVASSAPHEIGATTKASDPAVVAQARAAFIKYMSSHASVLSHGSWTSPGAQSHGGWVSPHASHASTTAPGGHSITEALSYNWSGFGDAATTASQRFSYVSGRWTVPNVTCPTSPYQNGDVFLAQWVGLDGLTNTTVEQLGSAAECFEGVLYYYVWYELYPAGTVVEGTAACINDNIGCPRPGDQISASVSVTPGTSGEDNYSLNLTDYTTPGNSFSVTQQCAAATCADASAEWIVERPAFELPFGAEILPLADFTRATFEQGSVAVNGGRPTSIQGYSGPVYDLAMIDDSGSYYLDCNGQPSPPGSQLLITSSTACPAVAPSPVGGFTTTWDAPF